MYLQYGRFKMAHQPDRWASKILALPVFSDVFAQAILASQYSNLALIAAMEVRSAPEFVVKVHEWKDSLDPDARDVILENEFMLEQYWSIASAIEKAYFASTANQLGFGLCDPLTTALSAEAAAARHKLAMKSLISKPQQPPRKLLKKESSDASPTPLLDQENAAKLKWSQKLEEIGKRAGACSKLLQDTTNSQGLSAAETARLRQLVLSSAWCPAHHGRSHFSLGKVRRLGDGRRPERLPADPRQAAQVRPGA